MLGALPLFLSLLVTTPAQAGYRESFGQGIVATDHGDWPQVVRSMSEAIRTKPQATGEKVKIYGMRFERYLPYFYLGLANYRQGNCSQALQAFQSSRFAQSVRGITLGRLKIYEDICRQRVGQTPPPSPRSAAAGPSPPTTGSGGRRRSSRPGVNTTPQPRRASRPARAVKQEALEKVAREARESMSRSRAALDRLQQRRQQGEAAFVRNPELGETLDSTARVLDSAEFLLEAARRERDLDAMEEARDDARAAGEVLEQVSEAAGRS